MHYFLFFCLSGNISKAQTLQQYCTKIVMSIKTIDCNIHNERSIRMINKKTPPLPDFYGNNRRSYYIIFYNAEEYFYNIIDTKQ